MRERWTEKEVQVLRDNAGRLPRAISALLPGRSLRAVTDKLYGLGLKRSVRWTKKEDALIAKLYPKGGAAAVFAKLPHRTLGSIRHRAQETNQLSRTRQPKWSLGEMDVLLRHYPNGGAKAVKKHLPNRTACAIRYKAHRHFRPCQNRPWTLPELAIIRDIYAEHGEAAVQERMPHRTKRAIARFANRNGIVRNQPKELSLSRQRSNLDYLLNQHSREATLIRRDM